MKKSPFREHTYWKMFLFYVLIGVLAITSSFAVIYRRDVEASERQFAIELQRAADSLCAITETLFTNTIQTCKQLARTVWVNKMYMDVESIRREFTAKRRMEIGQESQIYTASASALIDTCFLLFPECDVCIGSGKWTNTEEFVRKIDLGADWKRAYNEICAVTSPSALLNEEIAPDGVLIVVPVDEYRQPRSYWCMVLKWRRVSDQMAKIAPRTLAWARIENAQTGETLFSYAARDAAAWREITQDSDGMNWRYVFGFSTDSMIAAQVLADIVRRAGALLAFLLPLALLLSLITYRPIRKLMRRIGIQPTKKSAYEAIGDTWERMALEYQTLMRAGCLRRLLRTEPEPSELEAHAIPFSEENSYQTYLLPPAPKGEALYSLLRRRLSEIAQVEIELTDLDSGEVVVIAAFHSEDRSRDKHNAILHTLSGVWPAVFSGEICPGLDGIPASFRYAWEKYEHLYLDIDLRYYYPSEAAAKLSRALRVGEARTACEVLNELREKNDCQLAQGDMDEADYQKLLFSLLDTFRRNAWDEGVTEALAHCGRADAWKAFEDACLRLTGRKDACDEKGEFAREMLEFVQQTYQDSMLSLSSMEERFGVSASTINRLFKQQGEDTFYACLTRIRLSKACELLEAGSGVTDVSRQTGYENVSSFRRAFLRHTGVRPQDWSKGTGEP